MAIFAVILISIFITMSMSQIGNQMKSTRKRNENIELKYAAEAGTEQIIADIYDQIEKNTEIEIKKFEKDHGATIQYDTSNYTQSRNIKQNSEDNYLISHLDDAAKMYLSIGNQIRSTDSVLADEIVDKIYNPIAKNGYELDGNNLTLIGWAKEAQDGNIKALDLLIEKIGFNDNTDITPEYNGNNEVNVSRPNTNGIKKDIEIIEMKIENNYKNEFKRAEYNLNLSLYTATHMKNEHKHHVVSDDELEGLVVYYLDNVIKSSMESAFQEAAKTNSILAQEISFIQQKIFFLANDVRNIKGGSITRDEVIKKINEIIDEIVAMQVKLDNNNMNSTAILLEQTKRQLIEVKCRLGNVNLGGSEVIPGEPEDPTKPPKPPVDPEGQDPDDIDGADKIIEIPISISTSIYNKDEKKILISNKIECNLIEDIDFILKIGLKYIGLEDEEDINSKKIYKVITKNPYPSKKAWVNVESKYIDENSKEKYSMKSTVRFRLKDIRNKKAEYEILEWNQ